MSKIIKNVQIINVADSKDWTIRNEDVEDVKSDENKEKEDDDDDDD